ncbi:MAG: DsbA family protein [Pseudomonadota bacterium]
MTSQTIDYFFSAHSAFAYLGHAHLLRIARAAGATVILRPYRLSPVMEALGGTPFARRSRAHLDYFFGRELERWAHARGLPPIRRIPSTHGHSYDLANCAIIAAQAAGEDAAALAGVFLAGHWVDDADLSDPAALRALGASDAVLTAAAEDPAQATHDANTAEAIDRHVFGSPTYFLGGDMFYGQDRLDHLEAALSAPFPATAFERPN